MLVTKTHFVSNIRHQHRCFIDNVALGDRFEILIMDLRDRLKTLKTLSIILSSFWRCHQIYSGENSWCACKWVSSWPVSDIGSNLSFSRIFSDFWQRKCLYSFIRLTNIWIWLNLQILSVVNLLNFYPFLSLGKMYYCTSHEKNVQRGSRTPGYQGTTTSTPC